MAAARRLQITLFAAAFLLAGAEPGEMITAVIASVRHRPDLAAGDAIGANLTMLKRKHQAGPGPRRSGWRWRQRGSR